MREQKRGVKVGIFLMLACLIASCDAIKRVPAGKKLLVENNILVDSAKSSNARLENLLVQKPNTRLLKIPVGLHVYNLARPHRDSMYLKWMQENPQALKRRNKLLSEKQTIKLGNDLVAFNNWLKRTGEPPSIINEDAARQSQERLRAWYWNQGWFNAKVDYKIADLDEPQRVAATYYVDRGEPYILDSLSRVINSPQIDSLYASTASRTLLRSGEQYLTNDVNAERERLFSEFKNSGVYYMEKEYIKFEGDTINTNHKANLTLIVGDRNIQQADSVITEPFHIFKISKVNIIPDYQNALSNKKADTSLYRNYNIIEYTKRRYRMQSLTDAVVFKPGDLYRDIDRDRTYRSITQLNSFQYPNIRYREDPADSTKSSLIADVLLTSKQKYKFVYGLEATHNNIQTFGIGLNTGLLVRNLLGGSELLNISFRGNIGASANASSLTGSSSQFFDLQEFGADASLNFPRLFLPFRLDNLIPKSMSPASLVSVGYSSQTNIGLDRQSLNSTLGYNWNQTEIKSTRLDLIKAQYVRNLDPGNFFNVYESSYSSLNNVANTIGLTNPIYVNQNNNLTVPEGTNFFIQDVASGIINTTNEQRELVRNIGERRSRLVQDNLIISSAYTWTRNTQQGIYDSNFSRLTVRLESAGNVLAALASATNVRQNENGNRALFGVEFTQYLKPEIDYVKHWELLNGHVFAMRAFGGIAIPYGNSDNIPFIRSFFAGGPNDNRAWQAYELGPGGTRGLNDFNEANMKLAFNAEYRFPIINSFKGAIFADVGNIWNVLDSEDDPKAQFNQLQDLEFLALGTGFGVRYDFGFFVLRLDAGFKTYNPSLPVGDRWFRELSLSRSVLNVGINYPF